MSGYSPKATCDETRSDEKKGEEFKSPPFNFFWVNFYIGAKYRLTENILRDIIRRSVKTALTEGAYDQGDDENKEIYDVKEENRYRLTWWIRMNDGWAKWTDVSEGQEEFTSEREALEKGLEILHDAPTGAYAVRFSVERFIDTLSGGRWEYTKRWDGCSVRDILNGSEKTTPIGENTIRDNKQLMESLSLIERMG